MALLTDVSNPAACGIIRRVYIHQSRAVLHGKVTVVVLRDSREVRVAAAVGVMTGEAKRLVLAEITRACRVYVAGLGGCGNTAPV